MLKLYAITNGVTFDLSDLVDIGLLDYDAFGLPPVLNLMEQGPMQHGATWLDFRLGPRLVPIGLQVAADTFGGVMRARGELLDIFSPGVKVILKLVWDDDLGLGGQITRQLDCYVNGGLSFASSQIQGFYMTTPVELIAPDPTWYNPVMGALSFWLGSSAGFAIPTVVPIVMAGAGLVTNYQTINYLGSWLAYPVIRISGAVTGPKITNGETGDALDFTGITIVNGDYYDVDLRYGYKTVKNAAGTNKIADLTTASSLATFHINPRLAGEVAHVTPLTVSGSAQDGAARVDIIWSERYKGV